MMVVDQRVIVGPLDVLNEMLKAGVHEGIKDLAAQWTDVQTRAASDDWQFDMNSFSADELTHIKNHWLGANGSPWFADSADQLEQGFAHAMTVAGDRPVASIWVPANGFTDVRVSVVENPSSVVVVITSPMPPEGAETAGPDGNVTEFPPSGSAT
ncbi:MAG: hypothetical protein HKN26_12265 [Acidimicrobiales bacterium]|nr:hypothetical protein [Acidimicrobiales bacterium]